MHQYGGWGGGLAYAVAVLAPVHWVTRCRRHEKGLLDDGLPVMWLAVGTTLAVAVLFAVVYPNVDVHVPGRGSDADDALNIGARALLAGHSPYATSTYLGNELSPLPGALVLAMPFVLLGTSALQNLLWVPAFFLVVAHDTRERAWTLRLAWAVLLASPAVLHEILTGGDHSANTIYVLLGLRWLLASGGRPLAAAVWGVTLASRANFLLLLLPVCGWLWRHHGRSTAIRATAIAVGVVALLVLPLAWHHGVAGFAPLHGAERLTRFDDLVPHAGALILGTMLAGGAWLARKPLTVAGLLLGCAAIQAWPVLAGSLVGLWAAGEPGVASLHYGVFASWIAVMAVARSDPPAWSALLEVATGPHAPEQPGL